MMWLSVHSRAVHYTDRILLIFRSRTPRYVLEGFIVELERSENQN